MKKKFLFILLTLLLCLALAPAALAATGESPTQVTDENGLRTAVTSGGNIQLTQDIALTSTLTITGTVTIDLNGHVLKLNSSMYGGDASGSVIQVGDGTTAGTLTLNDTSESGIPHYFDTTNNQWALTDTTSGDKIVSVSGGVITGGSSSTGGGGIFNSNGTFTMLGGNIVGCATTEKQKHGGGVYVSAGCTFSMSGGTIQGCAATGSSGKGGGVYVDATSAGTGSFTMSGTAKIKDCSASTSGGGVYVYAYNSGGTHGSFTMNGGTIQNCTSGLYGGGVYNYGSFTMSGTARIEDCSSKLGGGVHTTTGASNNATFTMSGNSTITACSTTICGGGVYVASGTFNMEGGTISGNTMLGTRTDKHGGGVYVDRTGSFNMSGGTITGNKAANFGGGVYVDAISAKPDLGVHTDESGSFTMSGTAKIEDCSASTSGGGVYVKADGTVSGSFTMSGNSKITNCSAADKSDCLYLENPASTAISGIAACVTVNSAATCYASFADAWAAVPASGTADIQLMSDITTSSTLTITSTVTIDLNGHVLKLNSSMYGGDASGSVIQVGDGTTAGTLTLNDTSESGIPHYFDTTNNQWALTDTTSGDKIVSVSGGVITGGSSTGGGGIFNSNGTFTMLGGNIVGNTAQSGGGVYVRGANSTFTMTGGTISGNTAKGNGNPGCGGGVYATNGASVTMSGDATSITGNSTTGNGGGVYIAAPDSAAGTFTMNGGTIAQNTSKCGGGVYVNAYGTNKGELIMTAGSISGNTATESGGGVHVQGGSFTMSGGRIGGTTEADKNTAQSGGGGVYQNGGSFNMSGIASITGNMVTGEGGGVYMSGGSFTMSGTATISGNSANTNGGGVYICAENAVGTFTMEGGEIFGNCANNRGGGVSMYGLNYAAHFTMTGGSITGNSANDKSSNAAGGGVLADGANNSTFTVSGDVTIKDNVKSGDLTNGVYTGGKADNVLLNNANDTISVSGELTGGADSIGVTTATAPSRNSPVQFAKGTSVGNGYTLTKSDKKAFFPDLGTTGYYVSLNTTANTLSLNAGTAPHDHEWAYTLSEDKKTITATCEGTEGTCNFTGNTALTIVKPALTVYGGSESAAATIADSKSTIGEVTSLPAIQYAKKTNGVYGTAGTSAPTNAGEYKASITVGDKTAYVEYTIAKATPTAGDFSFNAPTGLTYDGNAKNATVTSSKNGMGAVTVKYFKDGEVVSEAKNAGAYTVKIDVAVSDNYSSVSNLTVEGWSFTIQPKSLVESMVTVTSSLTYTGSAQSPTVTVKDGDKTLTANTDHTLSGDTSKTNAGNYSISVTGTGNYTGTISNKTWSIAKATLTGVSVTQSGPLTYNGSAQSATVTENATAKGGQTVTFTYCDTANGDYSETVPAFTDAGPHTVYYKVSAPNHNDATGNFTVVIDPKPISITGATAADRSYDANNQSVEISGVTFEGAALTKGTDYTATGTMTDADADTDKTVTVTVALSNANYTLASNTTTTTVNISKIAYNGTKNNKTVNIVKNRITAQNGSLGLSDFLGLELPAEAKFTSVTPANGTMIDSVSVTDSALSYSSKTNIAAADDEDYTVTISTKNYEDFTVKLTFHSIDKTSVTITGLTAATGLTYDGAAKTGCTGTPNIVDHNDLVTALEYSYVGRDGTSYVSTTPPTNAGKYTLTVKVPDSDPDYTGSVSFDFEIKPKPVTVKPKAFIITRGAAIPEFELEYTGLVEGESLTPSTAPTFICVESDNTTAVSASTAAGTYTITWTNKDSVSFTNANYTVTKEATATLTISNPHYTGGSGSSSSSTSTTTKNPDGSTTTTTKNTNGVIGTTITDQNGNVTDVSAKIPASATNNGEAVPLPIDEVKPENGTTIDLDVPVGGATVKIPVEKPTAGTVVVIVDKDGTETVIPGSKVTENGIVVTLAENAAIKVIDNSRSFDDVKPGEYFSEPVQWASARKITVGISATSFGPHSSCTRAQFVTFLWRAAGQPKAGGESGMTDVANDTFYTGAVAWAVESGIVVGYGNGQFGSDDTITREQMAVILYRFAQKVGMDTTQSGTAVQEFNDYDSISEYALSAMQWAVNAGIMQGYANNLMPGQPCTRAQIVTMMYRLLGA